MGIAEIVNPDDVAVGHFMGKDELLLETSQNLRIRRHLRANDLQGNFAIQFAVHRLVYRSHSSFTEEFENLVSVGNDGSDLQQGWARDGMAHQCWGWTATD